ncbi:MAG: SprT-like domain-containing protein [Nitrospirales bacterium]|nr:SprT-like domain-containing protein [Nitrospirales bacterium]
MRQRLVPLEKVQAMWQSLARQFFENRLPLITIEWSTRLTASAGLFVSQIGPRSRWASREYRQGAARVIRLSAPLLRDQPEEELRRTLAHEMIHQWQFDIRKHRPSHGAEFREMMHRMNAAGLGVTVRHQLNVAVHGHHRYTWQCLQCGMAYHRQRRTIIPTRHICSRCRGKLVEVKLGHTQKTHEESLDGKGVNRGAPQGEGESAGQMLCAGEMRDDRALSTKSVFTLDDFREEFVREFGGPAMAPPTNGNRIDHNGT